MQRLVLDGEVDAVMLTQVISFVENLEGEGLVYFTSEGGDTLYGYWIVDLLNQYSKRIVLLLGQYVYSSAFYIAFNFKGKVIVSDFTRGMVHKGDLTLNIYNPKLKESLDHSKSMEEHLLDTYTFLNSKEKKDFKNNIDVELSNKQMKQIFKK